MTGWFFQNMVWASVAMLLVLTLRAPVARLFGAGTAYALWLLPALRLILPPQSLFGAEIPSLLPPLTILVETGEAAASLPPVGGPGQWVPILLALWAGGAALFVAWQLHAYRAFLRQISLSSRSAGAYRDLPLIESSAVDGPVAVGLLDRRIVVPADFASRYSSRERRLALEHERVHHSRGDIWSNLAALLVLALNWFNPIAWFAFRAFRADQELACDAAVTVNASPAERHDYARAMIKSASRPGLIAACPLNHADQLKRRLKMMKTHRSAPLRTLAGAGAVLLLTGVTASFGAPVLAHPHPEGEGAGKERRIVVMEMKGGEGAAERMHTFRVQRTEDGELVPPRECQSGELANIDETSGEQRTRVLLCSTDEADAGTRLERLQRARERLAGNEELSGQHRDRVLAALDREIARLRGN